MFSFCSVLLLLAPYWVPEFVTVDPLTVEITTECHGSLSVQDLRVGDLLLNKSFKLNSLL